MIREKQEILNDILTEISNIIIFYNTDLKKGKYDLIIRKSNLIFEKFRLKLDFLNIVNSESYGKNILFNGLTGNIMFPSYLYFNSFRIQIIKKLQKFIEKKYTIENLILFLSRTVISTLEVKKGGFNKKTLELLRFYMLCYDKVLDNSFDKFDPLFSSYQHKFQKMSYNYLKTRFPITQKYVKTMLIPNYNKNSLSSLLLNYENNNIDMDDLKGVPMGMLYDNQKNKKFLLLNYSQNGLYFF